MNICLRQRHLPRAALRTACDVLRVLALLALAGAATVARAQDLITERAYWDEPCTPVTLAELPQVQFRPYTGLLARGYDSCAVWLRLRIDPGPAQGPQTPSATKDTLVLRIRPSYLDHIALYDPLRPDAPPAVTGDRHRPAGDEYRALALHFLVPRSDTPRDVFLRLQTTSTRMMEVQALPLMQAVDQDRVQELLYSAYLALIGVSLLAAGMQWLHTRERVIGIFAFKQVLVLLWSLLLLGYGRAVLGNLVPPMLLDGLTSVLVLSMTAVSLYFDRALLHEYGPPRWGPPLLVALIAMLPLELALMWMGHASLALHINAAVACCGVVVVFLLVLLTRPVPDQPAPVLPRRLLSVFYGAIAVLVPLGLLPQMGLMPGNQVTMYTLFFHGLLTGVVMLVLLTLRSRRLRRHQEEAVKELALARHLVQQERVHRKDQEQLLDMLTHELKTPLSAMRMLLGTGQPSPKQVAMIQSALADMNDVVERCAQAGLLESRQLQALDQPCNLRAELETLAAQWRSKQRLALEVDSSAQMRGQGGAMVRTDPQLLRIVLANLIDNACKYSPPGSTVTARLARSAVDVDEGLAVDIVNLPGPAGWPDPQRVFAKYYRSPYAHRQTGSGLGLYLVAGLAQLLRARISYQPTSTHVCFRLWLPV